MERSSDAAGYQLSILERTAFDQRANLAEHILPALIFTLSGGWKNIPRI
jgi:hypothetical protein